MHGNCKLPVRAVLPRLWPVLVSVKADALGDKIDLARLDSTPPDLTRLDLTRQTLTCSHTVLAAPLATHVLTSVPPPLALLPNSPVGQVCGSDCCGSTSTCFFGQCCNVAAQCGNTCCTGGSLCIGGACCSPAQACGAACCAAGTT